MACPSDCPYNRNKNPGVCVIDNKRHHHFLVKCRSMLQLWRAWYQGDVSERHKLHFVATLFNASQRFARWIP